MFSWVMMGVLRSATTFHKAAGLTERADTQSSALLRISPKSSLEISWLSKEVEELRGGVQEVQGGMSRMLSQFAPLRNMSVLEMGGQQM